MPSLIINADDLGAGPGRDRGIFRAFTAGVVTSASLLANGPTFFEAVAEVTQCKLPVGVHLNLSEGKSLTGEVAGLTDAAGTFLGKSGLRRALISGAFDRAAACRELTAQIARVREAGVVVDHLDTHQHFLLFPALTAVVLQLCRRHDIRALRLPVPAEASGEDPPPPLGDELALYRRLAPAAASAICAAKLGTPRGLWGMTLLGRLDQNRLAALLRQIPDGLWELMVHPGFVDPGRAFSGPEREREVQALTAPAIRDLITERHLHLTTFGASICVF